MKHLVTRAKRGDVEAFTELIGMYMQDMYKVAMSILISDEAVGDAIQETILNCWEKIPSLKNEMFFKTWMIKNLINNSIDILNLKRGTASLDEGIIDNNTLELKRALMALDEKYRLILTLYYSQGYCAEEITKILGLSADTVQTRLAEGREKLAEYFYDTSFDRRANNE